MNPMDANNMTTKPRRSGSGSKVRKRMSDCLSDLAAVLPVNYNNNSTRGKLDKIEVVQLAVKYLNHMNEMNFVHAKNGTKSSSSASSAGRPTHFCEFMKLSEEDRMKEFTRGFNESINQTVQYLNKHLDTRNNSTFVVKLVNHLLGNLEGITDQRPDKAPQNIENGVSSCCSSSDGNQCVNSSNIEKVSVGLSEDNSCMDTEVQTLTMSTTPVESAQLLSSPPPPPTLSPSDAEMTLISKREISTQTIHDSSSVRRSSNDSNARSQRAPQNGGRWSPINVPSPPPLIINQNVDAMNQMTERLVVPCNHNKQMASISECQSKQEMPKEAGRRVKDVIQQILDNELRSEKIQIKALSAPTEVRKRFPEKSEVNHNQGFPVINPVISQQPEQKLINEPSKISQKSKSLSSDSLASPLSSASVQSVSPCIDLTTDANNDNISMETVQESKRESNEMPKEDASLSSDDQDKKSCISFKKRMNLKYQTETKVTTPTKMEETPISASMPCCPPLKQMASDRNLNAGVSSKSIDNSSTLRTLLISDQEDVYRQPKTMASVNRISVAHRDTYLNQDQITIQKIPNHFYNHSQIMISDKVMIDGQRLTTPPAPASVVSDALKRNGWEYQTSSAQRHINTNYQHHQHERSCCTTIGSSHHDQRAIRYHHPVMSVRSQPYPTPTYYQPPPLSRYQPPCPVINSNHSLVRIQRDANKYVASPYQTHDKIQYLNQSNH